MNSFMYDLEHFNIPVTALFLAFIIIGALVWLITNHVAKAVSAKLILAQAAHLETLKHVDKNVCQMPTTNPELFLLSRQDEIDRDNELVNELRKIRTALEIIQSQDKCEVSTSLLK